jgi:ketosteroid isomerase-like protein
MSKANVEIVRSFFEAMQRSLDVWEKEKRLPGSLVESLRSGDVPPETSEVFSYLSPEMEWKPIFSSETYRGQLDMARGWDELLEAAVDYRLELLDAIDLGNDRVFAVFGPTFGGRSSGIHVNAAVFAVVTLREGLITRLDEFTDRREALETAGLKE